jgi:hypothetical protein
MGPAPLEVPAQLWPSSREAGPLAQDLQRRGEQSRRASADQGPLAEHAARERYPAVRGSTDGFDAGFPARVQYPVIGVPSTLLLQGAA